MRTQRSREHGQCTRRQFLGGLCRGAAAASAGSVLGLRAVGAMAQPRTPQFTLAGRFGRMFHLSAFAAPTEPVRAALLELGKPGGIRGGAERRVGDEGDWSRSQVVARVRHLTWELPSGQAIAAAIGAPVLSAADLAERRPLLPTFADHTPLWYYILKEAELLHDGLQLGPVGGRIVGEVFLGLLQSDPDCYLNRQPHFTPSLPTKTGIPEDFRMVDFLTFAGVDPARRGQ
jgi:hypothetical protein